MNAATIIKSVFLINGLVHCIARKPEDEVVNIRRCLESSNVEVITRNNPKYAHFNDNFNIRVIVNPKGFLVPEHAADVQCIVRCGRQFNLKLTPKCGGHSFEKYSYGSDQHWVIDLRRLNYVNMDKVNGVAHVGSGLTVYDLAQKLIHHGYMLSTGTCLSVGVSGFTLGGGYGYMVRTYGLMIDRMIQMKLVTATSDLITTNPSTYPNLFWALRGAGANSFGIVTEFTFKAIPLPRVITLTKLYDLSLYPQIFSIFSRWAESEPDSAITPSLYFNYPEPGQILFFAVIRSRDESINGRILHDIKSRFRDISDSDFMYQSYNESLNTVGYYIPKNYFKAVNYFVSRTLTDFERYSFANAALQMSQYCYIFLDMAGGRIKHFKNGAFIHRKAYYNVLVILGVPAAVGIEKARQTGESQLWYINRFIHQTRNLDDGHCYQNYVDSNRTDWRERYFGLDYLKLTKTNQFFDPTDYFTCPQCI